MKRLNILPALPTRDGCRDCQLGRRQGLQSPGLPVIPYLGGDGPLGSRKLRSPKHEKAIVFIASHPGVLEDRMAEALVGPTGRRLKGCLLEPGLRRGPYSFRNVADLYLSNAVRCAPKDAANVGLTEVKTCRKHNEADIQALSRCYKEVIVMALGERAIAQVEGRKQSARRFKQGEYVDWSGVKCRTFASMNPAVLLPSSDPAQIHSMIDHFLLLRNYAEAGHFLDRVKVPKVNHLLRFPGPPRDVGMISLDIETKGILEIQHVFHPAKSMYWYKTPRKELVVSCSLTWQEGGRYCTKVYRLDHKEELNALIRSLQRVRRLDILGQNIQFDVLFLRAFDRRLADIFQWDKCTLRELQVSNFLDNDQRIEISLKELAVVMGVTHYFRERKLGHEVYESSSDPQMLRYNAKDTISTYICWEILQRTTALKYGPDTPKLAPATVQWYSRLLWMLIDMSEGGIRYDRARLETLHERYSYRRKVMLRGARRRWDIPFAGEGSQAPTEQLVNRIAWEYAPKAPRLAAKYWDQISFTDSTKKLPLRKRQVSRNKENLRFFLGYLPVESEDRRIIRSFERFKKLSKIIDSYTGPLLYPRNERKWNETLCGSRAFPSWHPVPSFDNDADVAGPGGTRQGRLVGKNPAYPTQPPVVRKCIVPDTAESCIVKVDGSQMELRVAAMATQDPPMLDDYRLGRSRHLETAMLVAGRRMHSKHEDPELYKAGKTLNFLTLYGGGAGKFRETLMREAGIERPLSWCRGVLREYDAKHRVQRQWQADLADEVTRLGYDQLPVLGITRAFPGAAYGKYLPAVVNMPIQAVAALLILDSQIELWEQLKREGYRARMYSNRYDEGGYSVPQSELPDFIQMAVPLYCNPPMLAELRAKGWDNVDLDVELEISYPDGREVKLDSAQEALAWRPENRTAA